MYKERPAIKIIDGILITTSCLSTFLYGISYWFILLTVALAVAAFILPGFYASDIAGSRLKVCSYGTTILSVFPFTLLVVVPAFIVSLFFHEELGWPSIITYACVTLGLLNAYFWTGIILVYLTSKQIGISKRLIGIFCGMIPVANLFVLSWIVKISSREVREESERFWRNEARKALQICKTRYPILMVHGVFFRDSEHLNYWGRVPSELIKNGATVFYGGQESAGNVKTCALQIKKAIVQVLQETGADKVNIIAHSKGGLDSRYCICMLGMAPYVASLTTVNTPHRGCEFAEYLMNKAPEKLKDTVAAAYNKGAKALGDVNPDFVSAVTDLTKDGVARLNAEMAPMQHQFDGIFTQSFGSKLNHATSGKFPLNMSYHFVKHFDGFNDGLVGEDSFQWGSEYHFLTNKGLRGISHADMIDLNRENIDGFDIREFYISLVQGLKERGL
ncbi:MAG: triacylglycerol lipase [Clostridiales bacterium]|nr:triacylglycerol lipase [Clostridiales bacterium]